MPKKSSRTKPMVVREGPAPYGAPASNRYEALELRCEEFARGVRAFVRRIPKSRANDEDISQLVRSSGSVGANYIEANEALGRKDFYLRIKTSRKEAKESRYWLRLLDAGSAAEVLAERDRLIQEATELMLIFAAIFRKGEGA